MKLSENLKKKLKNIPKTGMDYLVHALLLPWIWAWGGMLIFTFLLFLGQRRETIDIYKYLITDVHGKISLFTVWLTTLVGVFASYTLAFSLKKKDSRFDTLFFMLSIFLIFIFFIVFFPTLKEVFQFEGI